MWLSTPHESTVDSQRAKVTIFIQGFPKKNDGKTCRHGGIFCYNLNTWWGEKKSFGMTFLK